MLEETQALMGATRLASGIKAKAQQTGVLLVLSVNLYFVSFFPAGRVAPLELALGGSAWW